LQTYKAMTVDDIRERRRRVQMAQHAGAPVQQQRQPPQHQIPSAATAAAPPPQAPASSEVQNPQKSTGLSTQRIHAELKKREKNLMGIIAVFAKKKEDSEQIDEKRRKYETLLIRWNAGLNLLNKDISQWTTHDKEGAIQTIKDVDNCLKQHHKQVTSSAHRSQSALPNAALNAQPGGGTSAGASIASVDANSVNARQSRKRSHHAAISRRPASDSPLMSSDAPHTVKQESGTTQVLDAKNGKVQAPSAVQKDTKHLPNSSSTALSATKNALSNIGNQAAAPQQTPASTVPSTTSSKARASKKTIINLFRSMESYGYNDRMSDLMETIQQSRVNPEDSLFGDMGANSSTGFRKRKRRRIYVEEEEDVALDEVQSIIFRGDTHTDAKTEMREKSASSVARKTSFYSRPSHFRDFSNVSTGSQPNISGTNTSQGAAPEKKFLIVATQFKLFNLYARRYGFRELLDPISGDTYFEYAHSHSEKNNRKLLIYLSYSPNYSITYGFSQMFRFIESIKVQDSDTGYSWKDQEILLNCMTPHEFMSLYRSISHAVDQLRLRLCNDVSSLMSNVHNYDLPLISNPDPIELESAIGGGECGDDCVWEKGKNTTDSFLVASANGIGLRNKSNALAVELRTYHFGDKYTRPIVECRAVVNKVLSIPTLVVELDFSSADDEILQSFPVLSYRFMNASSILGMNLVFVKARAQFEKNWNLTHGKKNALFLIREWLQILQDQVNESEQQ